MRAWIRGLLLIAAAGCSTASTTTDAGGGSQTQPVCGDGICAPSEVQTCAADCGPPPDAGTAPTVDAPIASSDGGDGGFCGDGICDPSIGETPTTCPVDCTGGGGGDGGTGIDCSDETVEEECFLCVIGEGCMNVTESECEACGF